MRVMYVCVIMRVSVGVGDQRDARAAHSGGFGVPNHTQRVVVGGVGGCFLHDQLVEMGLSEVKNTTKCKKNKKIV